MLFFFAETDTSLEVFHCKLVSNLEESRDRRVITQQQKSSYVHSFCAEESPFKCLIMDYVMEFLLFFQPNFLLREVSSERCHTVFPEMTASLRSGSQHHLQMCQKIEVK